MPLERVRKDVLRAVGHAPKRTRTSTRLSRPQGPQPCASTNSATGARAAAEYSPGQGRVRSLSVHLPRYVTNTCSYDRDTRRRPEAPWTSARTSRSASRRSSTSSSGTRRRTGTRRPCATSARRSGWRRRRRSTPISRTSRSSGCCGATRPSRGPSSCSTARPTRSRRPSRPAACRSSAWWPPASRSSPRRTSRSTSTFPTSRAATTASSCSRVRGDSMMDAGILEGDYVVVRPQDTANRRRDRRGARGRSGGDGQALLPRARPRAAAAGERNHGADPLEATCASLGRVVGLLRKVA